MGTLESYEAVSGGRIVCQNCPAQATEEHGLRRRSAQAARSPGTKQLAATYAISTHQVRSDVRSYRFVDLLDFFLRRGKVVRAPWWVRRGVCGVQRCGQVHRMVVPTGWQGRQLYWEWVACCGIWQLDARH